VLGSLGVKLTSLIQTSASLRPGAAQSKDTLLSVVDRGAALYWSTSAVD
jgi:hypothetical protein